MPSLTVFTPTYNRVDLLKKGYEALLRQTSDDFEWLIIDDGSTDATCETVKSWMAEQKIRIRYIYKENGGLHTGYNKAIELIDTEICVCIDSDDYMPDTAVEKILETWGSCKNLDDDVAGIVGLDWRCDNNTPIGGTFPIQNELIHIMEITPRYGHHGDIKIVCRTDLLKEYCPIPEFPGEKNFNPFYYYLKIDDKYRFFIVNENFCYVNYQPGGMSANIINQYRNSPRSFACLREEYLRQRRLPLMLRFRHAVHYCSSILLIGELKRIFVSPSPIMTMLAFPAGLILYVYIKTSNKTLC